MREICFKAKRKDSGAWEYGLLSKWKFKGTNLFAPCIQKIREWDSGDYLDFIEIDTDTLCEFSGFTTLGKKIKVFENDKWELHFYSQLANGYVHNSGVVKRLKNGLWVCTEDQGVNSFELQTMVETYEGAFEIAGNVHDRKEGK